MTRIAVFNQKGGVGKTTTALNLAAGLNRLGHRLLLVDLDPQAHLSAIHGQAPTSVDASVFTVFRDGIDLVQLEIAWPPIGTLVPAHAELIKVDSIFGKGPNILNRLNRSLSNVGAERIVVIDCCPFLGVLSLNAVFAADMLLIPVASDHLSLRGATQMERTLRALEPVLKRRVPRRYLLTRFDRRRKMSFEIQARLLELYGGDVCATVISENVAVAESPAVNLDIFRHAPESRGAKDYAALIEELQAAGIL